MRSGTARRMLRRMKTTARHLLLLASATSIWLAAVPPPDAAQSQSGMTLDLRLPDSAPDAAADRGRRGPSTGDELYVTDTLVDAQGRRVGSLVAHLSVFTRRLERTQMVATIALRGRGSIALQGRLSLMKRRQGTLAVTGGTGEFAGAEGSARLSIGRSEAVTFRVTLAP
jgi:hypothetical protein